VAARDLSRPVAVASPAAQAGPMLMRIVEPVQLLAARRHVRANRDGAGGDGVTLDGFAARLEREIPTLAAEVANGRYRPGPLRRVAIPKADGGVHVLAIPCVRDRVAQGATLAVLQPVLEPRQSDASYAYRPARGVSDALAAVRLAHEAGLVWTLEADIAQCFDRIPHRRLLAELSIWVGEEEVLGLVAHWLHGFSRTGRGIAQGAPIAPLLCNLYLHPLDRLLVAAGHTPVRYADDFVVLSADARGAERARRVACGVLGERSLALKPAKTRLIPPGSRFRFLEQTLAAPQPRADALFA